MANLSIKYAGLNLPTPVIAASSGLTESLNNLKELQEAGVGAVVLKSIFEEEILMEMEQQQHQMTARPYVFPETYDYMDEDPHDDLIGKYLNLIHEAKKALDIPVIASINCISNQKWTYLATEFEKAGADAIELNIFSLPADTEKSSGDIENNYINLVKTIVNEVNIPVTVKISHYFTALGSFILQLSQTGIKGLVLFNRYYSPDIDIDNEKLAGAFVLSHSAEVGLPLRWIALMSDKCPVDFAATTGFNSGEACVKALLAGASVIEVASVVYQQGPSSINKLNTFILNWMKEKGYKFISDFKGKLSYREQGNPASWERVQFMKEFGHFIK